MDSRTVDGPRAGDHARVAVSVVHWGSAEDTLACLRSVAASASPARPLVVVDNGTGQLDAAAVERAAPGALVVALPENQGFTGGSNVAIRRALADGADAVVLLNNDAVLEPDALGALWRAATAVPRVGAVGAKVLSAADPGRIWATYGRLTYRAALVDLVGQGERDGPAFATARDVDVVPGCAMLLTRAALETVGLLDERYFAYHEDVDWCVRARSRGFRIRFAPEARVRHRGEGALAPRGFANPVRYLSARNTVLFARSHGGFAQRARLAAAVLASLPIEYVRRRRRGEEEAVALLIRGYRDGLLGREVPYARLGLR